MTGQSLLDRMELVNAELQNQTGEADATKSLLALNVAQDIFEAVIARYPKMLGAATGTVTTTAATESTAFPAGLLRLDGLDLLDSVSPNLPVWPLRNLHTTGSHAWSGSGVLSFLYGAPTTASPAAYWTNGTRIYWDPLPDQTYTIRWYGFSAASDITASGTFAYPDVVAFPLAVIAARLVKTGLDDDPTNLAQLGDAVMQPVIQQLGTFNRDGASPFQYAYQHDT